MALNHHHNKTPQPPRHHHIPTNKKKTKYNQIKNTQIKQLDQRSNIRHKPQKKFQIQFAQLEEVPYVVGRRLNCQHIASFDSRDLMILSWVWEMGVWVMAERWVFDVLINFGSRELEIFSVLNSQVKGFYGKNKNSSRVKEWVSFGKRNINVSEQREKGREKYMFFRFFIYSEEQYNASCDECTLQC